MILQILFDIMLFFVIFLHYQPISSYVNLPLGGNYHEIN